MIYGGRIFRVVTPNHPGCPLLEAAGAPPIRTEYVATVDPLTWCLDSASAFFFSRHLDAVKVAASIPHCHATTATTPEQHESNLRDPGIPTSAFRLPHSLPAPVRDQGTQHATAACAGDSLQQDGAAVARSPRRQVEKKPPSKRARMLALRQAHERTAPKPATGGFWWQEGQMA